MAPQIRILIADDEPDTLGLIQLTLETAGYQVHTALGAEPALSLMEQHDFDLLLLDIMMPGMSGFDLVRHIRAQSTVFPPVIFLTAKNQPEDIEEGKSLGAVDFLIKPTTRGELLDAIRSGLGLEA
ncbi:MAG: response regulator [Anaerolineales bacterium]|nr:response regulator [Anaerolineales bacterium]